MKVIMAPSKYIQGKNALKELARYGKIYGERFLVISDEFVSNLTRATIEESIKDEKVNIYFQTFSGECSKKEIEKIVNVGEREEVDVIVGVGGGKTLDTAKAVAYYRKLPVIIVPTLASTDAPTSALSVIYSEDGVFEEYLLLPKNPEIVLMDTNIIANAPTRLLVAGMGDALATYYEARVCYEAKSKSMAGGVSTLAAMALAKLCKNTLLEKGYMAKVSCDASVVSEALEEVVEANTYLSGIGFESSGLAGAHAIHNGFTAISDCHNLYHGEKVAFGTIVQLVLENEPLDEIKRIINFCSQVGLPTTLEDMGIVENVDEKIRLVSRGACSEGETIHNFPYRISEDMVYNAIILADKLGEKEK